MQLPWLPRRGMFALLRSGTAEMKHLMVLLEETEEPVLLENMGLGSLFSSFFFPRGEIWKQHNIILSLAIFKLSDSYQVVTWCMLAGCQGLQSGNVDIHLPRTWALRY